MAVGTWKPVSREQEAIQNYIEVSVMSIVGSCSRASKDDDQSGLDAIDWGGGSALFTVSSTSGFLARC